MKSIQDIMRNRLSTEDIQALERIYEPTVVGGAAPGRLQAYVRDG